MPGCSAALICAMIDLMKKNNDSRPIHLGGGIKSHDGLDSFKQKFGDTSANLYHLRITVEPLKYSEYLNQFSSAGVGNQFPIINAFSQGTEE